MPCMWRNADVKPGMIKICNFKSSKKQKLTPQELGPYVIMTITNGGAIRLETLDNQPMANFINGSQLRKYNEPLIDEILERMHTTKNAKVKQEQIKKEAQTEARLCAQQNQERRCYVQCINSVDSDEDFDPPILVNFSIDRIVLTFLIDSGVDVNVVSYEAFSTL